MTGKEKQLAQLVSEGKVRYVLAGPQLSRQKPEIARWLAQNAVPVTVPGTGQVGGSGFQAFGAGDRFGSSTLYDCRPS